MTAAEAGSVRFATSLRGYDRGEVDRFLQRVNTALNVLETGGAPGPKLLRDSGLERISFQFSFRGYNLDEVDDFLDRVALSLSQ